MRLGITVVAYDCNTLTTKLGASSRPFWMKHAARTAIGKFSRAQLDGLRSQVGNGLALLFNGVDEQQKCIASILCQYFKSGAYYQNGGCCERGFALGVMARVIFAAMIEFRGRGIEYFNVGAYAPCHRGTKWGTISDFKRRFSNQKWDMLICEKILDCKRYWRRIPASRRHTAASGRLGGVRMGPIRSEGGRPGDATEPIVMSKIKSNREFYSSPEMVDYYARKEGVTACERYAFDKCARPGDAILDIGVGGGRTTGYLAPKAGRYVGLDYSQEMVVAAQVKYPEFQFHCADASDLSFLADGSFDVAVFSFNGIDCIPHRLRQIGLPAGSWARAEGGGSLCLLFAQCPKHRLVACEEPLFFRARLCFTQP